MSICLNDKIKARIKARYDAVKGTQTQRGPYSVKPYNDRHGTFYVRGAACNVFGAASFHNIPVAMAVCDYLNELHESEAA